MRKLKPAIESITPDWRKSLRSAYRDVHELLADLDLDPAATHLPGSV